MPLVHSQTSTHVCLWSIVQLAHMPLVHSPTSAHACLSSIVQLAHMLLFRSQTSTHAFGQTIVKLAHYVTSSVKWSRCKGEKHKLQTLYEVLTTSTFYSKPIDTSIGGACRANSISPLAHTINHSITMTNAPITPNLTGYRT